MKIDVIRNEADYRKALARLEAWVRKDDPALDAAVEALGTLIGAWEDKHYPLPEADPIEAIRFRMEQLELNQNALARKLHVSSGRLSEVMNCKRALTLGMIRQIVEVLGLPASLLIQPYDAGAAIKAKRRKRRTRTKSNLSSSA